MFVVTAKFTLKEGKMDSFMPLIRTNAAASLADEPGCSRFDVCTAPDRSEVFLYELYDDAAAFEAHKQTGHFAVFNRETAPMIADKHVALWELADA
jgi:quinol monooxygenase YgiN